MDRDDWEDNLHTVVEDEVAHRDILLLVRLPAACAVAVVAAVVVDS